MLHEVTSQWLEDPKNPELIAQREALKQEVEYFDVKIARAQAELAGARAQDTAEARREQLARVEREFDEIVKRHARLAEVHQRIVEIFDSLAPVLAERDQLATDNQSGAWSVVRACEGSERTFEGLIRHLRHPEELVTREARAPAQDSRQGLLSAVIQ